MKKLLVLISLLGVVVLAGCGSKTPATPSDATSGATMKTFAVSGFSIQYPNTWTKQENVYGAQVMFFAPQSSGDQFRENLSVVSEVLPSDMTVGDYYTAIKTQITSIIKDYNELSNKDITLNGVAAKKIIYVGTQSNYKLKWMQVFLIKNKTAYVINYTATADTFDDFIDQASDIVDSFTLK